MRDRLIQGCWDYVCEERFVDSVTKSGHAFYGCLFKGRDLMEKQSQKECWITQTIIGLDFDHCPTPPSEIVKPFTDAGLEPWIGYRTFSDASPQKDHSFRLLWKVEVDLNLTYDKVSSFIKDLSLVPGGEFADRRSRDPSRLWQGSNKGFFLFSKSSPKLVIS